MSAAIQADRAREAVRSVLASVKPLSTLSRDGLVLIALEHVHADPTRYVPFADAAAAGLVEVRELSGGEAVAAVEAVTHDHPVVIFAGDTIVGGKQNRIVNISIWLAPHTVTPIPVTCLEYGRWDSGRVFASGRKADYALRATVNRSVGEHRAAEAPGQALTPQRAAFAFAADQGGVWLEISAREARIGTRSATAALHDVYERDASATAAFVRALPCPTGTTGVAVGVGGRLVAVELFDAPETLAQQWPRIVESAAAAHLDRQRAISAGLEKAPLHRYPDDGALGRLLGRAGHALAEAHLTQSIGEGTDLRLAGPRVVGAALLKDAHAVHVELFRRQPS